jgi:hypothetical protein
MVRYLFELDQDAILHAESANYMPCNEESLNLNLKKMEAMFSPKIQPSVGRMCDFSYNNTHDVVKIDLKADRKSN